MRRLPPAAWLFLAAVALHAVALGNRFVWDDLFHVQRALASPGDLSEVFLPGLRFRPLLYLPGALDATLWGARAAGWHLTNLLLHACVVVVAFHVVRALTDGDLAIIAASVVAVHPAASEVAAWVMARGDSLSALLGLGAMAAALASREPLAVALALASLLAKETGVAWLVLVPAACAVRGGRRAALRAAAAMAVALILYFAFRALAIGGGGGPSFLLRGLSSADAPARIAGAAGWYAREAALPISYAGYVGDAPAGIGFAMLGAGALAASALAFVTALRRNQSALALGIAWPWVVLGPSLLTAPAPVSADAVASRHLYAALPGIALIAAHALPRRAVVLLPIAIVAIFLSIARDRVWRSDESLWSNVLESSPESRFALANLGLATLTESGDPARAEEVFDRAVASKESGEFMLMESRIHLAMLRAARGDAAGASKALETELVPEDAAAQRSKELADLLVQLASPWTTPEMEARAMEAAARAEALAAGRRSGAECWVVASVLETRGEFADAEAMFEAAHRFATLQDHGLRRLASAGLERVRAQPRDALQRARALQRTKRCDEAMREIAELDGVRPAILEAQCAAAGGDPRRAAEALARAQRHAPGVASLCIARARFLAASGEREAADRVLADCPRGVE